MFTGSQPKIHLLIAAFTCLVVMVLLNLKSKMKVMSHDEISLSVDKNCCLTQHCLNACNIPTLHIACDKVRLIRV